MSDTKQNDQQGQRRGLTISWHQILGLVFLAAFVVFLIENNHQVNVRLIVPTERISLSIALLIAGVLGGIAMLLIQRRRRHK